jgi:hypothetical protein
MLGDAIHYEVGLLKNLKGLGNISHGFMDASLKESQLRFVVLLQCALLIFLGRLFEGVQNLQRATVLLVLRGGKV